MNISWACCQICGKKKILGLLLSVTWLASFWYVENLISEISSSVYYHFINTKSLIFPINQWFLFSSTPFSQLFYPRPKHAFDGWRLLENESQRAVRDHEIVLEWLETEGEKGKLRMRTNRPLPPTTTTQSSFSSFSTTLTVVSKNGRDSGVSYWTIRFHYSLESYQINWHVYDWCIGSWMSKFTIF